MDARYVRAVFGILVVLSPLLGQCQNSAAPAAAPNGMEIYLQHCAKCHGPVGEGISAAVTIAGPCLWAEHDPGQVMRALEVGPSHMPRFSYILSVAQMQAVSDYVAHTVAKIPLSGGNLSRGGELFRRYCATCHRTAVRGGGLVFVGTNAPALTGKSAAIIAGAIRWGPGPMPKFPATVLDDHDVASIVDYIRYAQQPRSPGGSAMNWYGPTAEGFACWVGILVMFGIAAWIEKGGKG